MKLVRLMSVLGLLAQLSLFAVYAPIPEQEQGKAWTITFKGGSTYDSNIFGSAIEPIDSQLYSASAKIAFNSSLTDQTFGTAFYSATLDHYIDRPGDKNLSSHDLFLRLAHAFSAVTTLDLVNFFQIARNPESLLAGLPLNTDQSFKRNQFDGSFSTSITEKAGVTVKYRNVVFNFDDAVLGRSLDRIENLYGLAGNYGILPEAKAIIEYRHQDIFYKTEGSIKDKQSDYILGGVDYKPSEKVTTTARLGVEYRSRTSEKSVTTPSAELSIRYDYAPQSFLAIGYAYALEEASNIALFNDTEVNRFFVNVQHAFTPMIVGSGSVTWEPSVLQGRSGVANVSETTLRFGVGLSYLPSKNWSVSLTYDYDKVDSDDPNRLLARSRVSLSASYIF